jgi:RPA family protein
VFSFELNSATQTHDGTDAYEPNYIITEAGAKINRVFITGVFTEKENVGSEDDPLWRARLIDPTGAFYISAGRFQPEAAKAIGELEPPLTLAIIGKIRTYTLDDGRFYVSVRPETVKIIDTSDRKSWILESSKSLLKRLECLQEAMRMDPLEEENLQALGYNKLETDGVAYALKLYNYNEIDLGKYEQQVREILVNLKDGLYDIESLPSDILAEAETGTSELEPTLDDPGNESDMDTKEDLVRTLVEELNQDSDTGANYQELLEAAESKGLTRDDTEECVNVLMTKGVIFEPSLGYLKSIER